MLELPAERQALVAVRAEERLDEAGEDADGRCGVEQSVRGRSGEDARLKSEAVVGCVC